MDLQIPFTPYDFTTGEEYVKAIKKRNKWLKEKQRHFIKKLEKIKKEHPSSNGCNIEQAEVRWVIRKITEQIYDNEQRIEDMEEKMRKIDL